MSEIAERVLNTVAERREVYGSPKDNMQDIADMWNIAFGDIIKESREFSATDVAQAMRLVKECRLINTPTHIDSLEDIVGYALVAEACLEVGTDE